MRKILLASTAIATTFVVASANAEVSISGGSSIYYTATSDDVTSRNSDEMLGITDNTINITFSSVTDNGLTLTYSTDIDYTSNYASVSGDFGTIAYSDTAHAAEAFDVTSPTMIGGHGDILTSPTDSSDAAVDDVRYNEADAGNLTGANIAYYSPSISGFSFGVGIGGIDAADDVTSWGVKYSTEMGGVTATLGYAASEGAANVTNDHVGAQVSASNITVGIGSSTKEESTSLKEETTSYAISYALNDQITLNAGHVNSDNTLASKELNTTSVGVSYTIASGLVAHLATNSFEYKESGATDNDGSIMSFALNMSF
jgi:hypothetical protein